MVDASTAMQAAALAANVIHGRFVWIFTGRWASSSSSSSTTDIIRSKSSLFTA
jgi:hypothetical protein